MTPPITLTPIELALYLAVYAREFDRTDAALAVCDLGRFAFPQYRGPWPVGTEVIAEHDAVMIERERLVDDVWRAVCIANEHEAAALTKHA